jgi:Glycosyl transferase family 2
LADVSLVIPSRRGGASLLDTVAAFTEETRGGVEIIVAECAPDDTAARIAARWPAVHVIHAAGDRTIPQLRAAGLARATGGIVAMAGDACAPRAGWLAALRRAHESTPGAVGGALENGSTGRLVDWAVFFCEYGRFMTPLAAEPRADLPAQNVSYSRLALREIDDLVRQATWEPLWHWRLAERGARLVRDGSIVVVLNKRFTLTGFLRERFQYARSFAAQRLDGAPPARRARFTAGCIVLPLVVLVRLGRDLLPKRRHLGWLLLSLPYLCLFACAWAAGEAIGYAHGAGSTESIA